MCEISTNRIHLRNFHDEDIENLFSLLGDPKIGQMLPKGQSHTMEETKSWLDDFQNHWEKNNFGVWALEQKSTSEFMGYCGLRLFPEFEEVEVLYSILPNYWGQGFATEAALASVQFGLRELQLKKIIGLTKMDNPASSAVLLNAGLNFIKDTEIFDIPCKYYEISNSNTA